MAKKVMVVESQLRGRGEINSGWRRVKHVMKGFEVLINPLVHGAIPMSRARSE